MLENKWYKVNQEGGTYITATLFNPVTKQHKTMCVRDYDYADCRNDNDEVYNMPIDKEAVREWRRYRGVISIGDTVKVVKGRKVAKGTVAKVIDMYDWKDKYGRVQTKYVVLDTGEKTSVMNCVLI